MTSIHNRGLVWLSLLLAMFMSYGCTPPTDNGNVLPDDQVAGDTPSDTSADGPAAISGKLALPTSASGAAIRGDADGYVVVAVSNQTQQDYRGSVSADGSFTSDIPADEAGNTFILTVLGPDSRPVGPILMAVADGEGLTGIKPAGEVDLGTIQLPDDPTKAPLVIGDDATVSDGDIDSTAGARLGDGDVPVGVPTFGKGQDSLAAGDAQGSSIDSDQDGLVDLFDADDDGNGVVDDFEDNAFSWQMPEGSDVRANFFMNLKINVDEASVYYNGTAAEINAALAWQTVITFECMTEDWSTRSIVGAHLLSSPAPTYLSGTTVAGHPQNPVYWADSDYAFQQESDRYDAFIIPNEVMQPGDTFTVEIEMDDGSTIMLSRMLNYIFKRIPRLVAYGKTGAMNVFNPNSQTQNGTPSQPVLFDGNADLVTEYAPPQDENGQLLTNLDYRLEFFFQSANGAQLNDDIDAAATWPTKVPGTDPNGPGGFASIEILKANLSLTSNNTYVITVPKEMFVDEVVLKDGSRVPVAFYKIDIAAVCSSGNAAIMWNLAKQ